MQKNIELSINLNINLTNPLSLDNFLNINININKDIENNAEIGINKKLEENSSTTILSSKNNQKHYYDNNVGNNIKNDDAINCISNENLEDNQKNDSLTNSLKERESIEIGDVLQTHLFEQSANKDDNSSVNLSDDGSQPASLSDVEEEEELLDSIFTRNSNSSDDSISNIVQSNKRPRFNNYSGDNSENNKCPGCFPDFQPNQLAHIGPNGCLGEY